MQDDIPYTQFACIGTGFSGIGLGATLKRWYNITDVQFFERCSSLGGTWYVNAYPGAACDVPSALYSFSFDSNPLWSRVLASQEELLAYLERVARRYELVDKMKFGAEVSKCEWNEERARWRLTYKDLKTGDVFHHESQFLFSAAGLFSSPKELDIPGAETFKGEIVHSSRWRSDLDLTDKKVIVIGNGCTGNQIVPAIAPKVKHLTHLIRSKHWIIPPIDRENADMMIKMLKWVPGAVFMQRVMVFALCEWALMGFYETRFGKWHREKYRAISERFMRRKAPEKYHDLLIPDFEYNCKRRIFSSGYLESLHRDNISLTDEKGLEVTPEGIRTASGLIEADMIVLANGFQRHTFLYGTEVVGRGGETIDQHWASFGRPEAYNCCAISGFPNYFMLLGPNTVTGHTSCVLASENSINYALRVIKPVLDGEARIANVSRAAEEENVAELQEALKKTVWGGSCGSWYVQEEEGQVKSNPMAYPWSQGYYWYSSLFPRWEHWEYTVRQPTLFPY